MTRLVWKRRALAALAVIAGIQVVRPSRTNPATDASVTMERNVGIPPAILSTLKASCFDCHSNHTRWPAYSEVAPVSWLIARDVRMGREDLNFSRWILPPGREPTPTQNLGGICHDVREQVMPPRSYLWMHAAARLDARQRDAICIWTREERARITERTK